MATTTSPGEMSAIAARLSGPVAVMAVMEVAVEEDLVVAEVVVDLETVEAVVVDLEEAEEEEASEVDVVVDQTEEGKSEVKLFVMLLPSKLMQLPSQLMLALWLMRLSEQFLPSILICCLPACGSVDLIPIIIHLYIQL